MQKLLSRIFTRNIFHKNFFAHVKRKSNKQEKFVMQKATENTKAHNEVRILFSYLVSYAWLGIYLHIYLYLYPYLYLYLYFFLI